MPEWILDIIGLSPRDISFVSDSESFHSADSPPPTPCRVQSSKDAPHPPSPKSTTTSALSPTSSPTPAKSPARQPSTPSRRHDAFSSPSHTAAPRLRHEPLSPDEVVIPTIFLTQGARNSRLLRQGEDIARQMRADEDRVARQRARFEQKRRSVLAELNSNGSAFVYNMKADGPLVDAYVEKELATRDLVWAPRHFYYFCDVSPEPLRAARPLEVFFAQGGGPIELARVVARHKISSAELALFAVSSVFDEELLDAAVTVMALATLMPVEADLQLDSHQDQTPPQNQQNHVSQQPPPPPTYTIERAMADLGAEHLHLPPQFLGASAEPFEPLHLQSRTLNLTIKYLHYNCNTSALVRRLTIVLLHFARRVTRDNLAKFVTYFLLAALDFSLNKHERACLVSSVGQVFSSLAQRARALGIGQRELLAPFHLFFARSACRIFGTAVDVPQKTLELHYTFLRNLVASGAEREIALSLAGMFLSSSEKGVSVSLLTQVAIDIARSDLPRSPERIYLSLYRAQLAALFVAPFLTDALTAGLTTLAKPIWRALHAQVLAAKDTVQQAVATLLYTTLEEMPTKVGLSKAISETYGALDLMSAILDKNAVYFRADIFYDKPQRPDNGENNSKPPLPLAVRTT